MGANDAVLAHQHSRQETHHATHHVTISTTLFVKVQRITCTINAIRSLTIRRNIAIYHNTMTRTKQTAKKSNGGSAPRVSLQVDTASAPAEEISMSDGRINRGDDKMEIDESEDHNGVSSCFLWSFLTH